MEVTRTYLQMTNPGEHLRAEYPPDFPVVRVEKCTVAFYRFLYAAVGGRYQWVDRLAWTDDQVRRHLERPDISIQVLYIGGAPAGYFELEPHPDGSVEIAYFGLMQEFLGQGLGKMLVSCAIDRAWEKGANRVWLHTCTLDDPAAMPNYLKRGFQPYKTEVYNHRGTETQR